MLRLTLAQTPGVSPGGQGTGLGAHGVGWGDCIQTPPRHGKGAKLAAEKSPLEPSMWETSPATRCCPEQDEPAPCCATVRDPQSPALGDRRSPALLRTGLLHGKNAQWVPEMEKV